MTKIHVFFDILFIFITKYFILKITFSVTLLYNNMSKNKQEEILYNVIITYAAVMTILYIIKPNMLYDHHKKKFRTNGFGNKGNIISLPIIGVFLSLIIYLFFVLYVLMSTKLK